MPKIATYLLILLIGYSCIAPLFSTYSPYELHLELRNLPPSTQFLLGTDELGRDLFARTAAGIRLSLLIALFAALIDLTVGVLWGSVASLTRGPIEEVMIRCCDIIQAIPHLLIVILLTVYRGSGLLTLLIAIGATCWIHTARITRAKLLQIRELDYMRGAKAIGASPLHILTRYLIPNAIGPILASIALTLPTAIFTEAFLSFLGLGIQAPEASLGVMVSDGLSAIRYYPWRLWVPSCALSLLLLSFHSLSHQRGEAA